MHAAWHGIRRGVARVMLAVLPGVGHRSPLEAPEEVAELIERFVGER